jgi:hypothetical protein
VRGTGRALFALVEGIALRLRTAVRLGVRALVNAGELVVRVFRAWEVVRDRVVASAREARRRVTAARMQLRLRLRLARRTVRAR